MLLQTALSNEYFLNDWINEQIYSIGDKAFFFFFLGQCQWWCGWEHRIHIRVWYTSNIILCFHLLAFMPLYNQSSWDGWMASPTQWTWVWVNSGSWRWTGRPGVLQSMGHREPDITERLNWSSLACELTLLLIIIIQEKWWNEVAEEQLRPACSPWLFLLLLWWSSCSVVSFLWKSLCGEELRAPSSPQPGLPPPSHEGAWKQLLPQLSFKMKAALANIFFFFNLFFKVDLLFSDFYSVWVFFFFLLPHSMLNASSLIRDQNHGPCSGSSETQPLASREVSPADILLAGSWKTGATGPRPPVPPFITHRNCEMTCCCFRPLSFRATCYTAICN